MAWKMPNFLNKRKTEQRQYLFGGSRYNQFAGVTVTSETALKAAAYYRGLVYISTQIAKLPFEVKNRENQVNPDHKVSILMNLAPNSYMSSFDFKVYIVQQAINTGNGYAEIERNTLGQPVALHPLRSDTITPVFVEDKLWYRVSDGTAPGADVFVPSKDMFVIKNFVTDGGFTGIGLAE